MFSSFDRAGGNQDGTGYLEQEGEWYVIASMKGPGAITRFWSLAPSGRIRIYIDDDSKPEVETEWNQLYRGTMAPFIKPYVINGGTSSSPHVSYLPILYKRFCKVAIQQPTYYQVEYISFPSSTEVVPFSLPFSKKDSGRLRRAGQKFQLSGSLSFNASKEVEEYSISRSIAAGDRIHLTTMTGPAVIRGIQMQWSENQEEAARDIVLRCYWDGESTPSIQVPMFDFFGGGTRTVAFGRTKNSWWYCSLPMPFQRMARLEIENSSERTSYNLDLQIFYQKKKTLPHPLRTCHALWKRENEIPVSNLKWSPTQRELIHDGEENFIALSQKGQGHLVAWGMDGTPFPESDVTLLLSHRNIQTALIGTGKYGFFDRMDLTRNFALPLSSAVVSSSWRHVVFRLFALFPISFEDGILLSLEHGSGNGLHKDYASTLFWYQENRDQPLPPMLPAGSRRFRTQKISQPILEFQGRKQVLLPPKEAEELPLLVSQGVYDPQDMFPYGPNWSQNQQIRFEALEPHGFIEFQTPKQQFSGWYNLECQLTHGPDSAQIDIVVNRKKLFDAIDLYDANRYPEKVETKSSVFLHATDGPQVRFLVTGRNKKSTGYVVGIDTLEWKPTQTVPQSLEVQGPYGFAGDPKMTAPRTFRTPDGDRLLMGFSEPNPPQQTSTQLNINPDSNRFEVGEFMTRSGKQEGLCFFSWEVQAERAGIYRFELEPSSVIPFVFREESGRMLPLKHRLLLNQVLLTGRDVLRYDPERGVVLPWRYRIPLQRGHNRLSWLLRCDTKTWIRPVLYGLNPLNP